MAARKLTAKERRELPARAFGIPSSRKYPVMVLNRSGEAVPSKSHAVDAKGRAKEELEKGRIDRRQYNQIVRKADSAIKAIDRARKKAARNPAKKKKAAATRKPAKRKAPKKRAARRRKNPSEADHERVGMEALHNSHEYWDGYMADRSKTNLLVDAYKFLVIAHEELKYAGDAEPRLEADHMLKAAHKELSAKLK
jgi:hypothetical protein